MISKKTAKTSMNDIAGVNQANPNHFSFISPAGDIPILDGQAIPIINPDKINEENKRVEYNRNIVNLDPDYANLLPVDGLIIRMYLREVINRGGLIIDPVEEIPIPVKTQNGVGVKETLKNPFPFSTKAIVVTTSAYEANFFSPGDVVLISQILPGFPLPGNTAILEYPGWITLPDYQNMYPTTDITSKHYGYVLLSRNHIKAILSKVEQ